MVGHASQVFALHDLPPLAPPLQIQVQLRALLPAVGLSRGDRMSGDGDPVPQSPRPGSTTTRRRVYMPRADPHFAAPQPTSLSIPRVAGTAETLVGSVGAAGTRPGRVHRPHSWQVLLRPALSVRHPALRHVDPPPTRAPLRKPAGPPWYKSRPCRFHQRSVRKWSDARRLGGFEQGPHMAH